MILLYFPLFLILRNPVFDIKKSSDDLNRDLSTLHNWAFQWKMVFNPDPNKQATEVIFSRKRQNVKHPALCFNNTPVASASFQKQLGLILQSCSLIIGKTVKIGIVPHFHKQCKTRFRDHMVSLKIISLYIYKDLRLKT